MSDIRILGTGFDRGETAVTLEPDRTADDDVQQLPTGRDTTLASVPATLDRSYSGLASDYLFAGAPATETQPSTAAQSPLTDSYVTSPWSGSIADVANDDDAAPARSDLHLAQGLRRPVAADDSRRDRKETTTLLTQRPSPTVVRAGLQPILPVEDQSGVTRLDIPSDRGKIAVHHPGAPTTPVRPPPTDGYFAKQNEALWDPDYREQLETSYREAITRRTVSQRSPKRSVSDPTGAVGEVTLPDLVASSAGAAIITNDMVAPPAGSKEILLPQTGLSTADVLDQLTNIMNSYKGYSRTPGGDVAINSLTNVFGTPVGPTDLLVLVLVESRLLGTLSKKALELSPSTKGKGSAELSLLPSLKTLLDDINREGYTARVVSADVYSGTEHRDGDTVLALRDFFRDVKKDFPYFQGAVFVGAFPEAMIVRSFPWKKKCKQPYTLINATSWTDWTTWKYQLACAWPTDYIEMIPAVVADRTDIVLGDLYGNWDKRYSQGPVLLLPLHAFPETAINGQMAEYNSLWTVDKFGVPYDDGLAALFGHFLGTPPPWFNDFFHVNDSGGLGFLEYNGKYLLHIGSVRDLEIGTKDVNYPNPIATPDILISRINAKNVAVNPIPCAGSMPSTDDPGKGWLDEYGHPQALTLTLGKDACKPFGVDWNANYQDPVLERILLIDYLSRNHAYRRTSPIPRCATAIAYEVGSAAGVAATLSTAIKDPGACALAHPEGASVATFVDWLKTPALLRGISAHAQSDWYQFGGTYDVGDLESECGGHAWRWWWDDVNSQYVPGFDEQSGSLDLYVLRSLWESGALGSSGGSFYLGRGCNASSPAHASTKPYSAKDYAPFQIHESLLFYGNGLALMGRSKKSWEDPEEFEKTLFKGEPFGETWRAFHQWLRMQGNYDSVEKGIDRKMAYWWGVLGDWTLKVNK